ncbi:MAG: hypothetical protein M1834_008113 [Cirrosporium novae-zelandiae]|nr:MAG: hypothetical protein M1834_008113 [Cirrosporium novae-zelandiae]
MQSCKVCSPSFYHGIEALFAFSFHDLTFIFLLPLIFYLQRVVVADYHRFLALGPGGTPSTFLGYLRILCLRPFALRDPLKPPPFPPILALFPGRLSNLPKRRGPRPQVEGLAPQRQITQKVTPELYSALANHLHGLAETHPALLEEGTSCFEKHSCGLFSICEINKTCSGEIAHAHPSDGSMHTTLHPGDVKAVIENGWGERHPLSGAHRLLGCVPEGFVMIYAPRSEDEIAIVGEIVRAAAWWVGGCELGCKGGDGGEVIQGQKCAILGGMVGNEWAKD